jgi:DNA repair exonuclease SbcCD ATPase subunit
MTIKIKTLTCRNFMSVGAVSQGVNFDRNDLTMVLGENLDLGGNDAGARNGVGKSAILNAISYALYGQAISNIRRDNLINLTNGKGMIVTIDFEIDSIEYRIERGRKPNVLRFFINSIEQQIKEDAAQGDSKETQADIVRTLGLSHDMFKHIVGLNTYTEPFLSLKANDQREIIEQLLGITLLSEKAEKLKELVKTTKDMITEEEYRIKGVIDANTKIQDQISSIERKQTLWLRKKGQDLEQYKIAMSALMELDVSSEIETHNELVIIKANKQELKRIDDTINRLSTEISKDDKSIKKIEKYLVNLEEHKCHACGQEIHDSHAEQTKQDYQKQLDDLKISTETNNRLMLEQEIKKSFIKIPNIVPTTFYNTVEEAYNHKSEIETLDKAIELKHSESDPYIDQIKEMKEVGLEEVSYDYLNELVRLREHQDFLLKLLTNKDSFIRKKIIDQNLSYLNSRLEFYLQKIGLPHQVVFKNDLSVEITELGRELDFDNLSRGERNRLILSLNFAFRDVWEGLYHPINLLVVDETLDSGMDLAGVENGLSLLKSMARERNKSIWLVSHKDELISRVSNIMKVVKENGFTRFESEC